MLYYSQKAEGEYLSEIAELKAALSAAKADRGKCRAILDGVVNVLVENGEVYCGVSAQIADLKTERDQLRAEVERLKAEAARPAYAFGIRWALQDLGLRVKSDPEAYDALERLKAELKCWTQGRADLQPVDSDYNNALIGIRWALQDLGLRVKSDPEATKSAVEVLCVQLRKEGRAWTGEMLGGLTCPSQMQKEDNAALKQRVFTALGTELLYRLERHHDLKPDLVAQFDLLGRDL